MKVKRIEHVGVIVRDVAASRRLWEDCLGIPLGGVEDMEGRPVRLALYPVGSSMVELIAGTTPDSKHARMVAEGRGGLNHICLEVENIDEALAELKAKGIAPGFTSQESPSGNMPPSCFKRSIYPYIRFAHDFSPLRDLGLEVLCKLIRTAGDDFDAERTKTVLDFG